MSKEEKPRDPGLEYPTGGRRRAAPLRLQREPSLAERIRALVRSEQWALEREQAGEETFEEADDFDVGDDYDPHSPYEELFDGEFDALRQQRIERALAQERQSRRQRQRGPRPDASDGAEPIQAPRRGSALLDASDGESPTSEGGMRS
ncbi:MAG: hypothetical protein QXT77_07495 [Candidatus Methanomethylicaceae archaeon]